MSKAASLKMMLDVSQGGGRKFIFTKNICDGEIWTVDHYGCALNAPYCVVDNYTLAPATYPNGIHNGTDPFDYEMILIKNNGEEVRRVAMNNSVVFGYADQSVASLSNDALYIMFHSNFGYQSGNHVVAMASTQMGSGPAPTINSFKASPAGGGATALSWSVTNATDLFINNGVGDVTNKQSVTITPTQTTSYTLSASNNSSLVTAQVTVVGGTPPVVTFSANPPNIAFNQASALQWSVSGANTVSIDQGIGDVTGLSSVTVRPAQTTTYTLTAVNRTGTTVVTTTVNITPPNTVQTTAWFDKAWQFRKAITIDHHCCPT
jgi:hypothetical protein